MGSYVDTNGIRLHYLERPGDGPTLLLAPGLAAGAYFYEALLDRLSPRLHVIAFDLRGRGASDRPDTGYTMADHAADMVGAMDAFGLERVVFGGHSFGGLLTYVMAAEYPDRIGRGVVIDAPAEVDPTVMEQIKPTLDRLETTFPSWDQYIEMVKGMPYYAGWEWDPALEVFYRSDLVGLSINKGSPPDNSLRDQTTIESFWRFQFAQNLAITPSVQLLIDPALNPEDDQVWVWGVRMRLTF